MLLHEALLQAARVTPDKTAVVHQGKRLSYGELDNRSSTLAALLVKEGVKTGDRVVLFLENSCEYVTAFLGVLKAGGVVVPMSVQMVAREFSSLLDDCTPAVVIADKKSCVTLGRIQQQKEIALRLMVVSDDLFLSPITYTAGNLADDTALASIIYTSGTTGKPKGVMLSHRNLVSNSASIIRYLQLTSSDSVMVILPFYYSYGNSLLTTHLMSGATLVIDNRFLYPNMVLETMEAEKVTGFAGVPSHFAILLRKSALKSFTLTHLRYVTQAGGAMAPALIKEFTEAVPHAAFFVMYGQTEASARLSYLEPAYVKEKTGSIGKAIPGVELLVLNEQGEKMKPGETGEIVAAGPNVMMGYWKSPEETTRVLRDNRLYTGDLARIDSDGFLFIISRKKDMIKSGANRISPLEIEEVVCQLKEVLECSAVGIPDELLGESIMLFVVLAEGSSLSKNDILLHCRQNLAVYKMPKYLEFVPSLPKTSSGKVKREELKSRKCSAEEKS